MTFMSEKEIERAIKEKKIRIAYYALPNLQGEFRLLPEKKFLDLEPGENEDEDLKLIRDYFYSSLKADSLYFHIGPYAKVEFAKREKAKKYLRSEGNGYIWNIRDAQELVVYPGESVVIGTNEYIELSGDIGASLYATVRKTDLGFSHISTIIDPWWEGVLQVGVSNLSTRLRCLTYLDQFCSVRFHHLADGGSQEKKVREDWLHRANNYWFGSNTKPIFTKWNQDSPIGIWERISVAQQEVEKQLFAIVYKIILVFIGIAGATSLGLLIIKLSNRFEDLDKLSENLDKLSDNFNKNAISIIELKKDVNSLDKQFIQASSSPISFSLGNTSKNISIAFSPALSEPPVIFVSFEGLPSNQVTYKISNPASNTNSSSSKYQGAVLTIDYIGGFSGNGKVSGVVKWLVFSTSR